MKKSRNLFYENGLVSTCIKPNNDFTVQAILLLLFKTKEQYIRVVYQQNKLHFKPASRQKRAFLQSK